MIDLASYLKQESLTQELFAKRIGVSQGYVAKLCRSSGIVPSLDLAAKIEEATQGRVPISYWLKRQRGAA